MDKIMKTVSIVFVCLLAALSTHARSRVRVRYGRYRTYSYYSSSGWSLSTGAYAGIVAGCIGAAIIGYVLYYLIRKRGVCSKSTTASGNTMGSTNVAYSSPPPPYSTDSSGMTPYSQGLQNYPSPTSGSYPSNLNNTHSLGLQPYSGMPSTGNIGFNSMPFSDKGCEPVNVTSNQYGIGPTPYLVNSN